MPGAGWYTDAERLADSTTVIFPTWGGENLSLFGKEEADPDGRKCLSQAW